MEDFRSQHSRADRERREETGPLPLRFSGATSSGRARRRHPPPRRWPGSGYRDGESSPGSATDYIRGLSAPVVFEHVLRTSLFGELQRGERPLKFDRELFLLRGTDLGQTERFMGKQRFFWDGADAATDFFRDKGVPNESIEVVWDAVRPSTPPGPPHVERKRPEIALACAGAGADVVGFCIDQLPRESVAEGHRGVPPPRVQEGLPEGGRRGIVASKPESAFGNFLAAVGERHVRVTGPRGSAT